MSVKSVIAIIPARGGSKGLPGKNAKILGGKPLLAWTIESALRADCITRTIVSTDSPEIADIAGQYGADVPFLRPGKLGTDAATAAEVVCHAIGFLEEKYDVLVLLQPTSPFRNESHIQEAFELYCSTESASVVSISETAKSPYWFFWRNEDCSIVPILREDGQFSRRQDLKKSFCLNGAIYMISCDRFMIDGKFIFEDTRAVVMDSASSVDIDNILDFKLAQLLLGEK